MKIRSKAHCSSIVAFLQRHIQRHGAPQHSCNLRLAVEGNIGAGELPALRCAEQEANRALFLKLVQWSGAVQLTCLGICLRCGQSASLGTWRAGWSGWVRGWGCTS